MLKRKRVWPASSNRTLHETIARETEAEFESAVLSNAWQHGHYMNGEEKTKERTLGLGAPYLDTPASRDPGKVS